MMPQTIVTCGVCDARMDLDDVNVIVKIGDVYYFECIECGADTESAEEQINDLV